MTDTSWLTERPAESLDAGPVVLRRAAPDDADELINAINESLAHIQPWMPWAGRPATPESIGQFLSTADAGWDSYGEFEYVIRLADSAEIAGCCGLMNRIGPGTLEIGYWVHVRHTCRGFATAAAETLTRAGLSLPKVARIEIHCDVANTASAAVPRKLGYRLERTEPRERSAPAETGSHMIWVRNHAG